MSSYRDIPWTPEEEEAMAARIRPRIDGLDRLPIARYVPDREPTPYLERLGYDDREPNRRRARPRVRLS